jgi:hypothetical protein
LRRIGLLTALLVLALATAFMVDVGIGDEGEGTDRRSWVVIFGPDTPSPLSKYVARLLGTGPGQLGATQAEYWTIPSSYWRRLAMRLRLFGNKVARLPDDWDHLLKRTAADS